MSLRRRFVLLFTAITSIILLLSSLIIYIFYLDFTKESYARRLENEVVVTFDAYLDRQINQLDPIFFSISNEISNNALVHKNTIILSSERRILFADTAFKPVLKATNNFLDKIGNLKTYTYEDGDVTFLGKYFVKEKMYIIISASDVFGIDKLRRLRLILFAVFFTSIIITATLAYFFVSSALKPLTKLNAQIQETSELNLWRKVDVGKRKDEIGLIAKNYNEMLVRMNHAFDLQRNFVHHASHELRTPLTVMFASTEAALNRKLTETDCKQVLASLKEDQNNLIELTNSLLLLYQFDKLKFSTNSQKFRIDEIVYDAIVYSKKFFPGLLIEFSFENIPEEKDLIFECNDVLLKAAFNNLIKNAFLYSDDKKLSISLMANDNALQINFDNVGRQLSESELKNIKIPFLSGEKIGLIKGIGLGLSIVDKIINLHKGSFVYEALPNSVNRFSVKLR